MIKRNGQGVLWVKNKYRNAFVRVQLRITASLGSKIKYSGDLYSKHLNNELIWIANFYLFGIQMVANWRVQTIQFWTMVKSLVTKWLLVCYSNHSLNTKPFDEPVLDHVNTQLVRYSDPHCIMNYRNMVGFDLNTNTTDYYFFPY